MKFKSKPGIMVIAILIQLIVLLVSIYLHSYLGIFIQILPLLFCFHLLFYTEYILREQTLYIKCGFYNKTIGLDKIIRIKRSNDPISAPAPSLTRVEILLDDKKKILFSPYPRDQFIQEIIRLQPSIQLGK